MLPKLLALFSITQSLVQTCLGQANREGGNSHTSSVKNLHKLLKTIATLTKNIPLWNLTILECQRACIRSLPSHFFIGIAYDITRSILWNNDIRDLFALIMPVAGHCGDSDSARHLVAIIFAEVLC